MDKNNLPPPYTTIPQPNQNYYAPPPPPIGLNVPAPPPTIGVNIVPPPSQFGLHVDVPLHHLQRVNYGPEAQQVVCPSCHAIIFSQTKTEPNSKTHMSALIMFCCLCWPCACLPYCMDSCQNINHYCPNCMAYLGTYQN